MRGGILIVFALALLGCTQAPVAGPEAGLGVGVGPPAGALVLFDGTHGSGAARAERDAKWVDWRDWPNGHAGENWRTSTRNTSPAGFEISPDPEFPDDTNRVTLRAARHTAPEGRWGYDDIEARPEYFHGDARVHVEWVVLDAQANSGVYLQNRYEVQVLPTAEALGIHGPGALVDEYAPVSNPGRANGKWQAYDVDFRAARWKDGGLVEPARMTVWWNGVKVHDDRAVMGKATGLQNTSGEPVDSTRQGLKLQYESGDVRFRNIWMKRID